MYDFVDSICSIDIVYTSKSMFHILLPLGWESTVDLAGEGDI